jgi:hypothetical protein
MFPAIVQTNHGSLLLKITKSQCIEFIYVFLFVYRLEYFISAGDKSAFSITKSGTHPRLSTRGKLDYETTPQYSIVVEGQDKANKCHKSRAMVQVNVIDVNDNFPTFKTKGYTARVPENAQRGAFVIKVFMNLSLVTSKRLMLVSIDDN